MTINIGDVFEFIAQPELKIYIIEEVTHRTPKSWSVHDRYIDWMCILEDEYIREKFRYVRTESPEEQRRVQNQLNPTHDDLRERAKEGTAWVKNK
jgi:hypothetical protein